jgi:hypothetical protein
MLQAVRIGRNGIAIIRTVEKCEALTTRSTLLTEEILPVVPIMQKHQVGALAKPTQLQKEVEQWHNEPIVLNFEET